MNMNEEDFNTLLEHYQQVVVTNHDLKDDIKDLEKKIEELEAEIETYKDRAEELEKGLLSIVHDAKNLL